MIIVAFNWSNNDHLLFCRLGIMKLVVKSFLLTLTMKIRIFRIEVLDL